MDMITQMYTKHYSVKEVANILCLSDTKVRRMFEREPGVLRIGQPSLRLGRKLKRRYFILRIPAFVFNRVYQTLTKNTTIIWEIVHPPETLTITRVLGKS